MIHRRVRVLLLVALLGLIVLMSSCDGNVYVGVAVPGPYAGYGYGGYGYGGYGGGGVYVGHPF